MRAPLICSLLASVVLALAGPGLATAQDDTVQRAVQDFLRRRSSAEWSPSPDRPRSTTREQSSFRQARPLRRRSGDLVYQGDVVRTEANGRIAINFHRRHLVQPGEQRPHGDDRVRI